MSAVVTAVTSVLLCLFFGSMWRVLDQKGISEVCYVVEIYHSGPEPSMCNMLCLSLIVFVHLSVFLSLAVSLCLGLNSSVGSVLGSLFCVMQCQGFDSALSLR